MPAGSEAWLIANNINAHSLLCIVANDREMEMMQQNLQYCIPQAEILLFPAWDCLPYDIISPKQQIMAERLASLTKLIQYNSAKPPDRQIIVITTANAALQKLPPVDVIKKSSISLQVGQMLSRNHLMDYLMHNGYCRVSTAMEAGEFAIRGNIIDIFPSGYKNGCRIDLFGDEIENILFFDAISQRSTGETTKSIALYPVSEVALADDNISRFRDNYRKYFGAVSKPDSLYQSVSNKRRCAAMEHWLPLFYDGLDNIFNYVADDTIIITTSEHDRAITDRSELIYDYYKARCNAVNDADNTTYNALPPDSLYLTIEQYNQKLASYDRLELSAFGIPDSKRPKHAITINHKIRHGRDFAPERKQGHNPFIVAAEHINHLAQQGLDIVIACISEGSKQRLSEQLKLPGNINVSFAVLSLKHGFVTENIAVISEQDIIGERQPQTIRKRRKASQLLAEAANFTVGELIVHKEHGIGKFGGLVTVTVQNIAHDCLKLIYADEDRLFLPVENIDIISRYGDIDAENNVTLDKLGASNWQARKAKLKQRIKLAADELLKIAAARKLAKTDSLAADTTLYQRFCAMFPYILTEDQEQAIDDIEKDLASGIPADRLICGDVGFGKTEVAMRAAFIAATCPTGKVQVAIITPTTLLARQHYQNFRKRFRGFSVNISMLSRLVNKKDAEEIIQNIATGDVDIIIGTHALLNDKIKFHNLGMLIIDEEQHFGVKQKEKLKKLRANIHVLTLSATPIPRTMQMALTGVKDLSLITTAPVDRLAIRTFITPFDKVTISEALIREYHRGGQSLYVAPYVKDLPKLQTQIMEMVPNMKLAIANGQMPATKLDNIMSDFYDGKYDILLSTNIIESGIDIPTANTLIIHRADRFGLSQLYQLRGRVGRSKIRAYAYLTLPPKQILTKNAVKRLEIMQKLDSLGTGFSVASHDMDIRGFGNLVGEEQSGHIKEVGIELYQQMLEEAVNELKKQKPVNNSATYHNQAQQQWQPQINLGVPVLIPEEYIPDLDLRLGLYRRAGELQTEKEIEEFAIELIDRFGNLPPETKNFIFTLKLKIICLHIGIDKIDVGPKGIIIGFYNNKVEKPEKLLDYLSNPRNKAKLRSDQKLVISFGNCCSDTKIEQVRDLLIQLREKLT